MQSTRITSERPSLAPVFGQLTVDQDHALVRRITQAEECLFELRDLLAEATGQQWHCGGLTLDTLPSGQASVSGFAECGDIAFSLDLTPANYWDGLAWRPGDPPKVMSHDRWEVTAQVWATPDRHGNEPVAEVSPSQHHDPEHACAALTTACIELRQLAMSRPATNDAWLGESH